MPVCTAKLVKCALAISTMAIKVLYTLFMLRKIATSAIFRSPSFFFVSVLLLILLLPFPRFWTRLSTLTHINKNAVITSVNNKVYAYKSNLVIVTAQRARFLFLYECGMSAVSGWWFCCSQKIIINVDERSLNPNPNGGWRIRWRT